MSLLERIYFFHDELLRERYPNAKTLADHFEVSLATARRDIAYLRDRLLAPVEYSQKKTGFYYTDSDFSLPFENSPKITFLLGMLNKFAGEAGLGHLDEVKNLEKRLASLVFPEYQKVVDSIHCEWIEVETVGAKVFEAAIESIVKGKYLEFSYRTVEKAYSTRKVEPHKLMNYQGRWYLLAHCTMRRDLRFFHMARMVEASVTKEVISSPTKLPDHFLENSFGIFKGTVQFEAKIEFTGTGAELVKNQLWHKNQKMITSSDKLILTLPVSDDRELLMKIMQYGSMARVLEPESLRQKVVAEVLKMQQLYT